jgi:hypothetical protein
MVRHSRRRWRSVIAIVQVAALLPAHAQSIWTGNTSSDWFAGGNWLGGSVTTGGDAFLDSIVPNSTVVNGQSAQAGDLVVGASFRGALTIGSSGTVTDTTGIIGSSSGEQCGRSCRWLRRLQHQRRRYSDGERRRRHLDE